MIRINFKISPSDFSEKLQQFWLLSGRKLEAVQRSFDFSCGSPVYTVEGVYRPQSWTEWTLGFHFGSALLQYDATLERRFLEWGRRGIAEHMAVHLTHMGVHDHGFNNLSTYGNLRRLMLEKRVEHDEWELHFYELALSCSAAVQARRWTQTPEGGFIYSFNGPHSLFADTIRSLRTLAVGYHLGHTLLIENDKHISLLERLLDHARMTARYSVYYGLGRDAYDVRGRVAHESLFNINDGKYRCPSTQQGYSPRSTWTRGLSWIMLGFAELLEYVRALTDEELDPFGGKGVVEKFMLEAARASCDFFLENSPSNGIPYWDTGAPGLCHLGDFLEQSADPFNDHEPVDSSAAVIATQGLLRLGRYLQSKGEREAGRRYWQAGLTVLAALLETPYLSTQEEHQGLILHSVYHRPNGWDYIPPGRRVPCGEAGMWGDYHAREVALYVQRLAQGEPYLTFWAGSEADH